MKKKLLLGVATAAVLTAGCSTSSKDIAPIYVSPLQYQHLDCSQISAELHRIHVRVNQLAGRLDEASGNDKTLTGVGAILFWPALFALGGTKQQEQDYARLKGEYEALQQVAVMRKCAGITPPVARPEKPGNGGTRPAAIAVPAPAAAPDPSGQ